MASELLIFDSPKDLAQAVADAFIDDARSAIEQRGAFYVALAGGTTPKDAYELLARQPRRERVDWPNVHVVFSDERCVPPTSEESNYKMAAGTLLSKVPIPPENVHRIRGEDEPEKAAAQYAALLVKMLGNPPRFDLIMLGMGADGHTASLFPGIDPHADEQRLVRSYYVEKLKTHRITFTPVVINNACHVLIATAGLTKAPALYAVREGPYEPLVHPIQVVSPWNGRLTWYVDRAAAAELLPQ